MDPHAPAEPSGHRPDDAPVRGKRRTLPADPGFDAPDAPGAERSEGPADGPPERPLVRRGLVPQALLDPDAVFVVKRLQKNGHEAYLVGGCVRDLLAGLEPKDFDVATDAHPGRIKRLFHSARIIGRRFRLVHVRFPGDHVVETSTFRGDPQRLEEAAADAGESLESYVERVGAENHFGTAPEDARRRDFTINALFYDPSCDEVIDFTGGLSDMEQRVVRCIGMPVQRLAEDPVRMIRAVHFAERLGFTIEPELEAAIRAEAGRIADTSGSRLYVELLKILGRARARPTLHRLWELGLLHAWIPELAAHLDRAVEWPQRGGGTHAEASHGEPADLPGGHATWNLLGAADRFGLAEHAAPESLALAVLFGPWILSTWQQRGGDGYPAFDSHVEQLLRPVALRMSLPRWAMARLRDVLWMLLEVRELPRGGRRRRICFRPGFAESLTLLDMDLRARDVPDDVLHAWRTEADEEGAPTGLASTQQAREEALDSMPPDVRRRGRRGGRRTARGREERAGAADGRTPHAPDDGGPPRRVPPVPAEADAWDPPPEPEAAPSASPAAPPWSAPPPSTSLPPPPPPRFPPAPPKPYLGDDDFSAGLA